jgi:hypothetical protein
MAGSIIWVLFAPAPIFFVCSAISAAVGRSFRAGVQAAVWTAVIAALAIYVLSVTEATHRYAIDGRTLGDGEAGYPIGVNLVDAIWNLVLVPLFGFPFGVFGAAFGNSARRRLSYDGIQRAFASEDQRSPLDQYRARAQLFRYRLQSHRSC